MRDLGVQGTGKKGAAADRPAQLRALGKVAGAEFADLRLRLGFSLRQLATALNTGESSLRAMEEERVSTPPIILAWLKRRVRQAEADPPPLGWQRRDTSPRASR